MSFVFLKFLHVALMFMGAALAIGPSAVLLMLARSGDISATRVACMRSERIFQISTACYGLGVIFGFAAALAGTLDLTASWLLVAYVLVALLGAHGIFFDHWAKRVARGFSASRAANGDELAHLQTDRMPVYLLSAMTVLVVAIVYVMVAKPNSF